MKTNLKALVVLCSSMLLITSFAQKNKIGDYLYDSDTIIVGSDSSTYKVENLGENINTKHVESGPAISPDGNTLYFFLVDTNFNHSKKAQEFHSDIYFSTYNESDKTWSKAKDIGKPLNGPAANSVQSVINDGNTLVLTGHYLKNGLTHEGLSMSHKDKKGKWSFPEPIKINIHFLEKERYSVYVNNEATIMILAVHEKESLGHQDLYVSFSDDKKHWTKPKNLGEVVNSTGSEATAFLMEDTKTLYFSSNGHAGSKGGFDIYKTTRLDSTWENWSKPVNMGSPYNTSDDEFYFSIPSKANYAYLGHHFMGADGRDHSDIVRIKLIKPKMLVMNGFLFDNLTKEKIPGKYVIKELPAKKEISSEDIDTTDGYLAEVKLGKKYEVTFSSPEYQSKTETVDATKFSSYTEVTKDVYLNPNPQLTVKGFVYNAEDSTTIDATIEIRDRQTGELIKTVKATEEDGYEMTLPGGRNYEVTYTKTPDYIDKILKFNLKNFEGREIREADVYLAPLQVGTKFDIADIFFAYDSDKLLPESYPKLDELVKAMKKYPKAKVELSAHTDARGKDAYNKNLSQRRAQSTVDYLISQGIPTKQFTAVGYGEEQIRNHCKNGVRCTDKEHEYNRRVQFKVLDVK